MEEHRKSAFKPVHSSNENRVDLLERRRQENRAKKLHEACNAVKSPMEAPSKGETVDDCEEGISEVEEDMKESMREAQKLLSQV